MGRDYKIICFVKNTIEDNKLKGLFHAWGSIDYGIVDFIPTYIFRNNPRREVRFGAKVNEKFLLISPILKPKLQTRIRVEDHWDILLVSEDFKCEHFPEHFFTNEMLVMYHGNHESPNKIDVESNLPGKVHKIKPGHHMAEEEYGYYLLLGIVEAWNGAGFNTQEYNSAKEALIQWFKLKEKLHTALNYLHNSLGGTPADISILTNGEERFDLTKAGIAGNTLQDLIDQLKGKTDVDFYIALALVRDALLEQAGVTGEN